MTAQSRNIPLKPYLVFYLIPVLMLLAVLIPFSFKQNAWYLPLCTIVVGWFALILAMGYLIMFEPHQRKGSFALILLFVMVFYNPIFSHYSLALKLETLNHQFLIFCNLCTAAVFTFLWWDMRKKKY